MPGPACPSCSYDLQAQITKWGARCPECGSGFTAVELATSSAATNGIRSFLARWKWIVLVSLVVPPFTIAYMLWYGLDRYWETWPLWLEVPFIALFWATPVLHLVLACMLSRRMDPPWPWCGGILFGILMTVCSFGVLLVAIVILGMFFFACC